MKFLEKAYPTHAKMVRGKKRHREWSILEDNDPAGYKSTAGKDAKKKVGIDVFELPALTLTFSITASGRQLQSVFASKSASSHAIR